MRYFIATLWPISFFCIGLSLDVCLYNTFQGGLTYSIDAFAKAKGFYFFFSFSFFLGYFLVILPFRRGNLRRSFFPSDAETLLITPHHYDLHPNLALADKMIAEISQDLGLRLRPQLYLLRSAQIRTDSCEVGRKTPPVLLITSACLFLPKGQLKALLATELCRLYRGASSIHHQEQATLLFNLLPFSALGSARLGLDLASQQRKKGGLTEILVGKTLLDAGHGLRIFFMLAFLVYLFAYAAAMMIAVLTPTKIIKVFFCRRGPDLRAARRFVQKEDLRSIKKLLKNKQSQQAFDLPKGRWIPGHITQSGNTSFQKLPKDILAHFKLKPRFSFYRDRGLQLLFGYTLAYFCFAAPAMNIMMASTANDYLRVSDPTFLGASFVPLPAPFLAPTLVTSTNVMIEGQPAELSARASLYKRGTFTLTKADKSEITGSFFLDEHTNETPSTFWHATSPIPCQTTSVTLFKFDNDPKPGPSMTPTQRKIVKTLQQKFSGHQIDHCKVQTMVIFPPKILLEAPLPDLIKGPIAYLIFSRFYAYGFWNYEFFLHPLITVP